MASNGETEEEVFFQKKTNAFNSLVEDENDPSSEGIWNLTNSNINT